MQCGNRDDSFNSAMRQNAIVVEFTPGSRKTFSITSTASDSVTCKIESTSIKPESQPNS